VSPSTRSNRSTGASPSLSAKGSRSAKGTRPAKSSRPAPSRPAAPNRRPLIVAVAIAAAVLVALVAALVAGSDDGDGGDSTATGTGTGTDGGAPTVPDDSPVTVTGTDLPAYEGDAADPAVGTPMPTLEGTALDGSSLTIPSTGRPTMIIFLAHWCPHCQAEVPVVQDWVHGGGLPAGVDLVSVSTATDPARPNYPPSEWLAREGWTAPVLVDGNEAALAAAGVSAFPFFVAVDADGDVVERTSGELTESQLSDVADGLAATAS
jgi:cytochrome c biogenesis protein CcmG, thiol:disulfide interchange protein DsbE